MKSRFKSRGQKTGFTLIETMTAVMLLAFIGVSVWIVLERCMLSAADTTQRMRAFEIARENMEKTLGTASVQESIDYGVSEQFPDIRWQVTIESFFESQSSKMWVRAVSSAEYSDPMGQTKSVELTHWLTDLTEEQSQQLMKSKELQEQKLSQYMIEGEDLAAEYAGVDVKTIREWVKNHMPTFNGSYLKPWLDFYLKYNGNPTPQQIQDFKDSHPELATSAPQQSQPSETGQNKSTGTSDETDMNPPEEKTEEPMDSSAPPPPPK
jgi:Tfp pilus assembly protein PilV